MPRHDQYGTHDEGGRGPSRTPRGQARDQRSASPPDRGWASGEGSRGRHAPNYGNGTERAARTSQGGGAAFQSRDFERENYGGGYGIQRKSRDVPAAGRKGEWMQGGRRAPGKWRGQIGGDGMDGLASERAFGTEADEQMSRMDTDRAYRRWREAELEAHDDEYRAWRRDQAQRYDEDYARWKSRRRPRSDWF